MSTNDLPRPQSRRTLLTAALAGTAAGGLTFGGRMALACSPQPDPIFAAIEKAHAAYAAYSGAIAAEDRASTDANVSEAAREEARLVVSLACDGWVSASDALFRTVPTTAPGLVALLDAWWAESETDYGNREPDLESDRDKRTLRTLIDSAQAFGASIT